MRSLLIAGNWKMNGSLAANRGLLEAVLEGAGEATAGASISLAVCMPAPYLAQGQALLAGTAVVLGAQDVSRHASGAYTGEQSAAMLAEFACRYVIVGHSERRVLHAETSDDVAGKAQAALGAGIAPIICVGESAQERESGATEAVIAAQLAPVLALLGEDGLAQSVIAYEPVWAIGTGKTATPEMAQQVHAFIRAQIAAQCAQAAQKVQILYGGSMKPDNAAHLLAMADIDGGLIGGASLKATDFLAIAQAAR